MINKLSKLTKSIKHRGINNTFHILFNVGKDIFFDWQNGTNTVSRVDFNTTENDSPGKHLFSPYEPTRLSSFKKLIHLLKLPNGGVFCDYGSGKGRVLLAASLLPFDNVIGIDLSKELCLIASSNIKKFQKKYPGRCPIEIVNQNADMYIIPDNVQYVYMFNPFGAEIMKNVLQRIKDSLSQSPRKFWLIYFNPVHQEVVWSSGLFSKQKEYLIEGDAFLVYTNFCVEGKFSCLSTKTS